ncbi:MAG: hypothetical protein IPJ98_07225 [Bryobacterales bacterium]|nr:hypothetical protein [Bryobacterales bacterium]
MPETMKSNGTATDNSGAEAAWSWVAAMVTAEMAAIWKMRDVMFFMSFRLLWRRVINKRFGGRRGTGG